MTLNHTSTSASFPSMVHAMLSDIDDLCKNDPNQKINQIVSWLPHGQAFKIHDREKFTNVVMPIWFMRLKYVSWVRQLNQYGFKTIQDGPDRGALYHKDFVRDEPELAHGIGKVRRKCKADSYSNQEEPNSISSPPSPRHVQNVVQAQDTAEPALCPSVSGGHGSQAVSDDVAGYLPHVVSNVTLGRQETSNIGIPSAFSSSFDKFTDPLSQGHSAFNVMATYSNMNMMHQGNTFQFVGPTPIGQPNSLVNLALPSFRMNPARFAECSGVPSAYEPCLLDSFEPEPLEWVNTLPAPEERTSSYIDSFF